MTHRTNNGFTLLELLVFIVILGIVTSSVLLSFTIGINSSGSINNQVSVGDLAGDRMNLILGKKATVGFDAFSDPCPNANIPLCTVPVGYTVTSSITTGWNDGVGVSNDYKVVAVTVSGKASASTKALVSRHNP